MDTQRTHGIYVIRRTSVLPLQHLDWLYSQAPHWQIVASHHFNRTLPPLGAGEQFHHHSHSLIPLSPANQHPCSHALSNDFLASSAHSHSLSRISHHSPDSSALFPTCTAPPLDSSAHFPTCAAPTLDGCIDFSPTPDPVASP